MALENFNKINRKKHPKWSGWYYIDLYKKLNKSDNYIKKDIVIKGLEQKHYSKKKRDNLIELLSVIVFLLGVSFFLYQKG